MKWAMVGFLSFASLVACGGSAKEWTPKDNDNATDIVQASAALEAICDRDGGVCDPRSVRSIESGICKAGASMLFRHNQPIPDAGMAIGCGP